MPERSPDRNHLEGIPEVRPAFGQWIGIVAHALVQQRHECRGDIEAHPAAPGFIEVAGNEQALETGNVVEVGVGDEQRARRFAVLREIVAQAFVAAIDREPRRAIALDRGHRRSQLNR